MHYKDENGNLYSLSLTMHGTDKHGADSDGIRRCLHSIDKSFDVEFNYDSESYLIYFNGTPFQVTKFDEFSKETLNHIEHVYELNRRGKVVQEVDEHNAKIEQDKEKDREDMTRELAKDLRKALMKEGL